MTGKMEMDVKVMDKHFKELLEQKAEEKVPRRMDISKQVLEEYGYTKGCQGCRAIIMKTARQGHSEGCRKRLEREAKDDPGGEQADQ